MAEREGFEPPVPCDITGFQDQRHKPLGHLSSLFEPANLLYNKVRHLSSSFFPISRIFFTRENNRLLSLRKGTALHPVFTSFFYQCAAKSWAYFPCQIAPLRYVRTAFSFCRTRYFICSSMKHSRNFFSLFPSRLTIVLSSLPPASKSLYIEHSFACMIALNH